jgi:hypothetical protein
MFKGFNIMRQNFTSINILLDRSGSMQKVSDDTIGGLNTFLNEQRKVKGDAVVSLATFASDYTLIHDFAPLDQVGDISNKTYKTAGFTALLDSIGKMVNGVGAKLAAINEADRPSQVLFVIISDGEENRSKEFTRAKIFEMISHQRDKYNWNFVYIGCNQDQIQEATNLGIAAQNAVIYDQTKGGTKRLFRSISENAKSYRISGAGQNSFFDQGNAAPTDIANSSIKIENVILPSNGSITITPKKDC